MTVWELKARLSAFDDGEEVVIADNSRYGSAYAYEIRSVSSEELCAYYGGDHAVVTIKLGEQVGAV